MTEDFVFLREANGLKTGVDIDMLVAARQHILEALLGEPLYGYVADAGLPTPRSQRGVS